MAMSARLRSNSHWMNLWILGINTGRLAIKVTRSSSSPVASSFTPPRVPVPPSSRGTCYIREMVATSLQFLLFFSRAFFSSASPRLAPLENREKERRWQRGSHPLAREIDDTVGIKPPECSCFRDSRLPRATLWLFFPASSSFRSFDSTTSEMILLDGEKPVGQTLNSHSL